MAEYLKIPELARRLDVSEKTVRRYIKSGALPSTFIGGAYRVTEEDLEEYIHRAEVKPESPKAGGRSSLEPKLFNGGDELLIAIDYTACREALQGFCTHWEEVLREDRLDRRAFEDFEVSAACLSRVMREVMGVEQAELGLQEAAGEPVHYSERSVLWPAIDRFISVGIRMDRLGKERFGEDLAGGAEVVELREYAQRKAG